MSLCWHPIARRRSQAFRESAVLMESAQGRNLLGRHGLSTSTSTSEKIHHDPLELGDGHAIVKCCVAEEDHPVPRRHVGVVARGLGLRAGALARGLGLAAPLVRGSRTTHSMVARAPCARIGRSLDQLARFHHSGEVLHTAINA